jgi:hypothetical protein
LAIDGYPPCLNDLLTRAARTKAAKAEITVKPHRNGVYPELFWFSFRQARWQTALLPQATSFEELNALTTGQYTALRANS